MTTVGLVIAHEVLWPETYTERMAARFERPGHMVWKPNLLPRIATADVASDEWLDAPLDTMVMAEALEEFGTGLRTVHQRLVCVGIGDAATAAWLASESGVFDTTVCFYGSGIRDHADMVPKGPCLVVLAALERPFDTLDLADRLHGHPNTTVVIYDARDGFCDEDSPHYDAEASGYALQTAVEFIDLPR